jgi:hypothetical protein
MSEGFPFFAMSGNLQQLVSLVNCGKLESGLDALLSLLVILAPNRRCF